MEKNRKVVVIGHGYTSRLGLIRSLGSIGCEITVIVMVFHNRIGRFLRFDGGKPVDCHSKYVSRVLYCHAKDEENLINLLLDKCTDTNQKVVIIPDSDFSASVIDNNQNRLKDYFLFPHINHTPGAVEHWMQKTTQKQLAREVGLNVADGKIVTVLNQKYEIPDGINYPCFTKPLLTINGGKSFLKRCNNESELRRVLDGVGLHYNADVLVEDFIPIDTEYAVVGFSDGKDVIIPGVIEFIVNSQSHFGIAREGKIMPIDGFEEQLFLFKEYVRRIGFCGLFDIDFFRSNGKIVFGEMNLRFGGSGYAYTAMGVNLPVMFVKSVSGESIDRMKNEITGQAKYVNERMCVDDWSFYYLTEQQYKQIVNDADICFVYDKDDIGPQRKLNRYICQQRIKRKLRKWITK